MKKRFLIFALVLCIVCGLPACASAEEKFSQTWLDMFDTVIVLTGYAADQDAFDQVAQGVYEDMLRYHRLYDVYNVYDGVNNIKTINDCAGGDPVTVDAAIIDLLREGEMICEATNGRVDVTMGSVLALWHEARTESLEDPDNAYLPDEDALREAAAHTGFDKLEIDEEACTVRLTDPDARLDVGALAKGYAVQRVCEALPTGYIVSAGGNVFVTGAKPDGSAWKVAVQKPYGGLTDYLHVLAVTGGAIVTSGDYQRYYTVDGVNYHHIIDPDTLQPARYWQAVTVLCADSGIADGLSTALFLMPREDGQRLLDRFDAQAVWVSEDGECFYSAGYEDYIVS